MAGIISEAINAMVEMHKTINGKIWDEAQQVWLDPTPESEAAADQAVNSIVNAAMGLLTFPIEANVMGIVQISVDRAQMETVMGQVSTAIKNYTRAVG